MRTAGVVLYLLTHQRGPLDVLRASVDLGGDVDSVAALCLGLVGGSQGLRFGEAGGLPWALLEELEGVEYLVSSARGFEAWAHAEADKGRGVGMARSALVLAAVAALVAVGVAMATTHLRPS